MVCSRDDAPVCIPINLLILFCLSLVTGNTRNSQGDVIDRKTEQWFGATVTTSRDSDLVVVSRHNIY